MILPIYNSILLFQKECINRNDKKLFKPVIFILCLSLIITPTSSALAAIQNDDSSKTSNEIPDEILESEFDEMKESSFGFLELLEQLPEEIAESGIDGVLNG